MFTLEVQIGAKRFADLDAGIAHIVNALDQGIDGAAVPISRVMRDALQRVAKAMEAQHSRPWNGGVVNNSPNLQKRSGDGINSIRQSIRVTGASSFSTMVGRISAGSLSVHETGATIRARRAGGYLTIPLPAAMDSRGVPLRKRARDWQHTFVARSRKGNLIIFQKRGRKDIRPLYLLKPEVTIRPRLGMEKNIHGQMLPYFHRRAMDAIERAIDRSLAT